MSEMFWESVAPLLAGLARWQAGRWERAFLQATSRTSETQNQLLLRILSRQLDTDFGRQHHFASISSIDQYRKEVPIHRYEDLEPFIHKVRQGNTKALLTEPLIHMFALTSGTTASRKYIPVTPQYLKDYRRATSIWGKRIFDKHEEAYLKPILQLVSDWNECQTESGVPCGSVSGLTTHMQKPVVRWLYCLPASTGKIKEAAAKLYLALRLGLMRHELGILASANPSTLVKLAQTLQARQEDLLRDLRDGTLDDREAISSDLRRELRPLFKKQPERVKHLEEVIRRTGKLLPKDAWQPIHTIGCWTGGSVGLYLRQFKEYYGDTPVRDLGLLASEGRMTIPLDEGTPGGVVDISSHFFEFIPELEIDSPTPNVLLAHEVQQGQNYYIIPTTAYGLYRYNIYDVVRVLDFHGQAPIVEFLNKGSLFSNLTGEKLSEFHVVAAMKQAAKAWDHLPQAYTLAPTWDDRMPRYSLFLEEHDLPRAQNELALSRDFDLRLKEQNTEYETKRDTLRLGCVELCLLPKGTWHSWDTERIARSGGSPEQYKRPCLINDPQFKNKMPVLRTVQHT
jgi:hypothetical protein